VLTFTEDDVAPAEDEAVVLVGRSLGIADWALSPLYKYLHRNFQAQLQRSPEGLGILFKHAAVNTLEIHFNVLWKTERGRDPEFEWLLRALVLLNPKVATALNIL